MLKRDDAPRTPHKPGRLERLRRRAGGAVVDRFFRSVAFVGKFLPDTDPDRHGIEVLRDLAYRDSEGHFHLLDVLRPEDADGPLPICMYVHGGGFRILSKDTHFGMAMQFARRGYLVFNINYRLAPDHPFPAAIEDTCDAYVWMVENAERFGGDLSRIVLAGESAGANLVTSLTIAATYQRPEPYAQAVWETGVVPRAVAPACGIFQVSDIERFAREHNLFWFLQDRLTEVTEGYLPDRHSRDAAEIELADPLVFLEQHPAPERDLPPFFLPVGTGDPLVDDTRRLAAALETIGVDVEPRYYDDEPHAFHAFVWRPASKDCWRDKFAFLDAIV